MSEQQIVIGTVTPVLAVKNEKELCSILGVNELYEWLDTHEGYEFFDDTLWIVTTERDVRDIGDIFQGYENGDGSVDFVVSFYNGGCSLPEAIKEAYKNRK